MAGLQSRRTDLEGLVRKQKEVIASTRHPAAAKNDSAGKAAREASRASEAGIQKTAATLAADKLFAGLQPPLLKQADAHLGDAVTQLGTTDVDAAFGAEQKALDLFQQELDRLTSRVASDEHDIAVPEFQRFERDQSRNRTAADSLAEASARLGNTGIALPERSDSCRWIDAVRRERPGKNGRQARGRRSAPRRSSISRNRDRSWRKPSKSLLTELRTELQSRIVADLTEMHEIQQAIRETTEAQAPRVAQRSRTALLLVVGLSQKEAELGERTEQLAALTEETEFGIALPTALKVLSPRDAEDPGVAQRG